MLVELPFRLLCEDATYEVTVENCTIPIQVLGNLVEMDAGGAVVTIDDGTKAASNASWAIVQESGVSIEVRAMRTVFAFATTATPGTLRGLRSRCRETLNAHRFAGALLDGHIEHINRLINCYRVAGADPFPFEVTAWDLQGLYVQLEGAWHAKISLIPYVGHNENPVESTGQGTKPILFTTPDEIRKTLAEPLRKSLSICLTSRPGAQPSKPAGTPSWLPGLLREMIAGI